MPADPKFPAWEFFERPATAKQRESSQSGYFTGAKSIDSALRALVRESIQNSLDAAVDPLRPVRLRLATSGADSALSVAKASPYFDSLWAHIKASGSEAPKTSPCHFLVFEDFETTGLTGDPQEIPPGSANNFMHFFRVEGASSKGRDEEGDKKGRRGRRGVGKIVFPMASAVGAFFGLTVRSDDDYDEGAGLLMGQSALRSHRIGPRSFEGDGWWGRRLDDHLPVEPLTNPATITRFREDWAISRTTESGLSLVIPYLEEPWSVAQITEAIAVDYFSAILMGRLEVSIESLSGEAKRLDADRIVETAAAIEDLALRDRLIRDLELLSWARDRAPVAVPVRFANRRPSWDSAQLSASIDPIASSLSTEQRVFVSVPVMVETKDGAVSKPQEVKLILAEEAGTSLPATYIRSGIIVAEAGGNSRIHGYRAIALIDDEYLSMMLGDAEGAAHVDWSSREPTFKDKYREGREWLSLVRRSPAEVIRLLSGASHVRDDITLSSFFPETQGQPTNRPAAAPDGAPRIDDPRPDPPDPQRGPFSVRRIEGGFEITFGTSADTDVPEAARVSVAYDRRRGDPFSGWTEDDFVFGDHLSDIALSVAGARLMSNGNVLLLSDLDPASLRVRATGFDPNRDVVVRVEAN